MIFAARASLWLALAACSSAPAPTPTEPTWSTQPETLCITNGDVTTTDLRTRIATPTARGFAPSSDGNAAALTFTYHGTTSTRAALASGDVRSQLGLKLRAQDSCNVLYVMWRIEPRSEVVVQLKRNPGLARHADCGATNYARIKPTARAVPPALQHDTTHTLAARIVDDHLAVWIDHALVWRGALPRAARSLRGPAGFRTDNVDAGLALHTPVDVELALHAPIADPSFETARRESSIDVDRCRDDRPRPRAHE